VDIVKLDFQLMINPESLFLQLLENLGLRWVSYVYIVNDLVNAMGDIFMLVCVYYTRKNAQVVTDLQTSCNKVVKPISAYDA
jgi:hypothetical protein